MVTIATVDFALLIILFAANDNSKKKNKTIKQAIFSFISSYNTSFKTDS